MKGGRGLPTTNRHTLEYVRGGCYFLSYTAHFMGLAALPLAQIAAIKFSGPLMITVLSVALLGEMVGPRRWLALFIGFLGVLLIVRPGVGSFNIGSMFILLSVLFYALAAILTRKLQPTDSSATMSYYSSLVYLVATLLLAPLLIAVGDVPNAHPSIAFLFRPWAIPSLIDALPISVMWGFVIWRELPTWTTWAGAGLTLASGLYILYRERKERARKATLRSEEAVTVSTN